MAQEAKRDDQGIGEGNLRGERGAPPYADRAYAGEQEPTPAGPNTSGSAGGANVSQQGGGSGSSKQGGNTGSTPNASG